MITGVVDDGESGAAMQAADDEKIVFGNQPGREFQFVLAQKVRLIELVPTAAVPDRFQLVGEAGADAGTAGPDFGFVRPFDGSGGGDDFGVVCNRRAVEFFVKIGIDEIVGIDYDAPSITADPVNTSAFSKCRRLRQL